MKTHTVYKPIKAKIHQLSNDAKATFRKMSNAELNAVCVANEIPTTLPRNKKLSALYGNTKQGIRALVSSVIQKRVQEEIEANKTTKS